MALAMVASVTAVYYLVVPANSTTVALTLLLGVLAVASRWGLLEAVVASIAAMLSFNFFFLPPVGTLTIADPENWVALVAFIVTAVVASHLSASAKRQARQASAREREVDRLYSLSRSLMFTSSERDIPEELVAHLARILPLRSVAFFDHAADRVVRSGDDPDAIGEAALRDAAIQGTVFEDRAARCTILPVTLGGRTLGSLGFSGGGESESGYRAVANLAAIAIERARDREAAARAEAARQSQELKSTILDSVAHDFKTPLTSIKAAATALLQGGLQVDTSRDLVQVIDEEADRLNVMVTDAIQTARIEAGDIRPRREPCSAPEIVQRTLAALARRLEGRTVSTDLADDLPAVVADPGLIGLVLRQILDNALKYSPPDSPVHVSARQEREHAVVSVADRGTGVANADRRRIFERLYRGERREQVPGTGMGLAIARQIVETHGGRIWVEERSGGGSVFSFSLPVAGGEHR